MDNQNPPQPVPPAPTQNINVPDTNKLKVFQPKTLGIIALVCLGYNFSHLIPVLTTIIWLVATVITYMKVTEYKKGAQDNLMASDESKVLILMAVAPVSAQALFYYRLRNVHPNLAKAFNSFGWKVFIVEIIVLILVGSILITIFGPNT